MNAINARDAEAVHDELHHVAGAAGGVAADRLRSLVDRIERLAEERKALGSDIRDLYVEAVSAGFDAKVLRRLIVVRKLDPAEADGAQAMLDIYREALAG